MFKGTSNLFSSGSHTSPPIFGQMRVFQRRSQPNTGFSSSRQRPGIMHIFGWAKYDGVLIIILSQNTQEAPVYHTFIG